MKIVINKCFGGFGLSTEAVKRAIADGAPWVSVSDEKDWSCNGDIKDAGDGYKVGWMQDVLFKDGKAYSTECRDEKFRTDPILLKIVEDMGKAANGKFAKLVIVEVPDDVEWELGEYDGIEHVAEKHRTWG